MILIEGVKGIGKSTNFKGIKFNQRELYYNLNKNIIVDRMFLKEYVYANRYIYEKILQVQVFDIIIILLPYNIQDYIVSTKLLMIFDKEFKKKIDANLKLFNKKNKKKLLMDEFLKEQIIRYCICLKELSLTYDITMTIIRTNQKVKLFRCKKKHMENN